MHGAGLINHNFMKPHTSFIEILPCMFGSWFTHNSFKLPSQKENIIFAWQIQAYNPVNCHPSRLESHNHQQGVFVPSMAMSVSLQCYVANYVHMRLPTCICSKL